LATGGGGGGGAGAGGLRMTFTAGMNDDFLSEFRWFLGTFVDFGTSVEGIVCDTNIFCIMEVICLKNRSLKLIYLYMYANPEISREFLNHQHS
jgi:hypothetical protein